MLVRLSLLLLDFRYVVIVCLVRVRLVLVFLIIMMCVLVNWCMVNVLVFCLGFVGVGWMMWCLLCLRLLIMFFMQSIVLVRCSNVGGELVMLLVVQVVMVGSWVCRVVLVEFRLIMLRVLFSLFSCVCRLVRLFGWVMLCLIRLSMFLILVSFLWIVVDSECIIDWLGLDRCCDFFFSRWLVNGSGVSLCSLWILCECGFWLLDSVIR